MAFLRKRRKISSAIPVLLSCILLIGVMTGGLYYLYQNHIKELQNLHEEEIQDMRSELYRLERQVMVPKKDIPYGSILSIDFFNITSMRLEIEQHTLLDESDMGKINTVILPKGIPVVKTMITEEKIADDVREHEFNMFLIQTNQLVGDYVDIRITFPNGENYIVLGKKQLKGLNREENIVWIWVDEEEIHLISSAIIDAYRYPGTKISVTTYVQPQMQEDAIAFYPANFNVLDLMKKDPNLLQRASDTLAREARKSLENHLVVITNEDQAKVSSGVNTEISRMNEIVKGMEWEASSSQKNEENDSIENDLTEGR